MDVVSLTEDLVAIPSHDDETVASNFVTAWLRDHTDGTVRTDEHGNGIARKGSGDQSLALVGHHDVVAPDDSQVDAGENAIYRATDAADVVRDMAFPTTEVLGHELRGSVAVTEIDGGSDKTATPRNSSPRYVTED